MGDVTVLRALETCDPAEYVEAAPVGQVGVGAWSAYHETVRLLLLKDRRPLEEAASEIVGHTARAHGCTGRVEVTEGEPATVNEPALANAACSLLPAAGLALAPPMRSCGSDDFGFSGQLAPALMAFVGLKGAPDTRQAPHRPQLLPPEEAVRLVARTQAVAYVTAVSES
jgi:metal-dependent amidase/aminoacylase/carboxypeptidase family protein